MFHRTPIYHRKNVMNRTSWCRATRATFPCPRSALRVVKPRPLSTKPDDLAPHASQKARSRIGRITSRLPARLQRYTTPLLNAPLTHITAFLLLHELTAVLPLFGLAGVFHYTKWMPPFVGEGKWVADGAEKFGNWFRRKGWLGEEERRGWRARWWGRGEGGTRVVVEYVLRSSWVSDTARLMRCQICYGLCDHEGATAIALGV